MKNIYFKTFDEKTRDGIADKVFKMIQNGKFSEAYALRDIVLCTVNGKECEKRREHRFIISVDDCVPATFSVSTYMKNGADGDSYIYVVDSELFTESLRIPNNVGVGLSWREDVVNRYKIIKLNRDKIRTMIHEGASPDEIGEAFGIEWSEEGSRIMIQKD